MPIQINQLQPTIHYSSILEDFIIVCCEYHFPENTTKKWIGDVLILDELSTKALSIVYQNGLKFYALFPKNQEDFIVPELRKMTDGKHIKVHFIKTIIALKELNQSIIIQLFFNKLANFSSSIFAFSNLSGHLYLFQKSEKATKIALEIKVNSCNSLELNVITFSKFLKKTNKAQYILSPLSSHKNNFLDTEEQFVLRRLLPSEKIKNKGIVYIKGNSSKKNSIDFLSVKQDKTGHNQFFKTKIGKLSLILDLFKEKNNKYLEIDFYSLKSDKILRYEAKKEAKIIQKITIVDEIKNDVSREIVAQLKSYSNEILIKESDEINPTELTIRLIYSQEYYEQKNDIYKKAPLVQHITIDSVREKHIISASLKELLIKKDVVEKNVSIINWKDFNFKKSWTFALSIPKKNGKEEITFDYFELKIQPNGKMEFSQLFEEDLIGENIFEEHYLLNLKNPKVEGIVKNHLGQVNIIEKTALFSLPNFVKIKQMADAENQSYQFKKEELLDYLQAAKNTLLDVKKLPFLMEEVEKSETLFYDKSDVNSLISMKIEGFGKEGEAKIRKFIHEMLLEKKGISFREYYKNKETRYDLMDSQLDIHYSEEESLEKGVGYYFVGHYQINGVFPKASIIRKVKPISNSSLFFEELLPLLNVDFIRASKELTVIPFPFKYLREYATMAKS